MSNSADVIVIGSGAGGAAVAGEVARNGGRVLVLEAGPVLTDDVGRHSRRSDQTGDGIATFLDFFHTNYRPHGGGAKLETMPGLGAINGVGGMLTSWTNNTPRHDVSELPAWLDWTKWDPLVKRAESLLRVSREISGLDPRTSAIAERVRAVVGPLPRGREVSTMPTAAAIEPDGRISYSAADTLLEDVPPGAVEISPDTVCQRLVSKGGRIEGVQTWSRLSGEVSLLHADTYVVAAGAVGTPQLLSASDLETGPALGAYLTEHAVLGTRVALTAELRANVPAGTPTFAVWAPASSVHPWSSQVTRHPIAYTDVLPEGHDPANTADLIAFCPVQPDERNALTFHPEQVDAYGLPRVTGRLSLSSRDWEVLGDALREQLLISASIADLEEGWASALVARGGSTHVGGTTRMGAEADGASVVDSNGRLWGYDNAYVAGNSVLSEATAGNPTLSAVAFGLRTADVISQRAAGDLVRAEAR